MPERRADSLTIALDAMGGDFGPSVVVPAAERFLARRPRVDLILVGVEEELRKWVKGSWGERLRIRHASQTVGMDEPPTKALRNKKDSSMRVAIDLVRAGEAQACVSAGNTGALMATARFVLKTLAQVDRPAIITAIPSLRGQTHVDARISRGSCPMGSMMRHGAVSGLFVSALLVSARSVRCSDYHH